jgi:hypothetical protein
MVILLAVGLGALLVDRGWALARTDPTDFDDAYMYLRYAEHALHGHWLAWNSGEGPVYGVTSLLHLVMVTAIRGVLPGADGASVLELASGLAALGWLGSLTATWVRFSTGGLEVAGAPRALVAAFLLAIGLVFGEAFVFHAHSGMDTMVGALGATLCVFTALALAEAPSPGRALGAALIGVLAIEARPDNAIIAALCPALALRLGLGVVGVPGVGPDFALGRNQEAGARSPRQGGQAHARATRLRCGLLWAVAFVVLVAIDVTLKWRLLGTPLPLAFYAKRPGFYRGFAGEHSWNPYWFLEVAAGAVTPFLLAVLMLARRRDLALLGVLLGPALVTVVALFGVNQIMGHLGRFFFPALAPVVLAGALVTDRRAHEWRVGAAPAPWANPPGEPAALDAHAAGTARAVLLRIAGGALVLLGGARALDEAGLAFARRAAAAPGLPAVASIDGALRVAGPIPLPEIDSWLAAHQVAHLAKAAPPGTTLALSEHGLVGAEAPDTVLVDLLGLHDRAFSGAGFSTAELWRRRPDLIWMPHPDHTRMLRDILDSDELWRHYDVYPDAFTFGFALRRDGPRFPALAALFAARWKDTYPGLEPADHAAWR